ncbi:hypothetical protein GF318_02815 [Candidatus Micrarchaeota archaeon]|nr:hypothetical protein [Candidatus Micrarchaeota archaeon]
MNESLLAGLVLLLLFGCAGQAGSPANESPAPGGGLGDADVSVQDEDYDDGLLSDEELIPPPEGPGNQSDGSKLEISDIFVEEGSDFDLISEEDIIEPV